MTAAVENMAEIGVQTHLSCQYNGATPFRHKTSDVGSLNSDENRLSIWDHFKRHRVSTEKSVWRYFQMSRWVSSIFLKRRFSVPHTRSHKA